MDFDQPPSDPLPELRAWLEEAAARTGLPNPAAMTVATVDARGRPSARIVLLKGLDDRGAVFFTNRRSRKGRELAANPWASLLFHWDALERQIRIEGPVELTSDAESDAYFATRPRESQIGAWASDQSDPVENRAALEQRVMEVAAKYEAGGPIPRPPHWGGYRVALETIEFWQGHPFRVHDRVIYTRQTDAAWRIQRLCP